MVQAYTPEKLYCPVGSRGIATPRPMMIGNARKENLCIEGIIEKYSSGDEIIVNIIFYELHIYALH